jgi:hypothetical protein
MLHHTNRTLIWQGHLSYHQVFTFTIRNHLFKRHLFFQLLAGLRIFYVFYVQIQMVVQRRFIWTKSATKPAIRTSLAPLILTSYFIPTDSIQEHFLLSF